MTNQEAIEILKGLWTYLQTDIRQALGMAIKALEQEPSGDLISRQAVLKQLRGCLTGGETEYQYGKLHIDSIPSVKQEPKTGHWITKQNEVFKYYCDKCGTEDNLRTNYCPNCGAKMKGVIENESISVRD